MNKVKIEKNIKYKRADNKVVNPDFRPLNIDYDRYVTIKNNLTLNYNNPEKIITNSVLYFLQHFYQSFSLRFYFLFSINSNIHHFLLNTILDSQHFYIQAL